MRIASEADTALLRVRAGDIQLVGGNVFTLIEDANYRLIVFTRITENIRDDYQISLARQNRKFVAKKSFSSDVLQANCVQHSGSGFEHSRRRIARHRLTRESFYDKATELVERNDVFEFDTVTESPTGSDDRVLEIEPAETDAEIGAATRQCGGAHSRDDLTTDRGSEGGNLGGTSTGWPPSNVIRGNLRRRF